MEEASESQQRGNFPLRMDTCAIDVVCAELQHTKITLNTDFDAKFLIHTVVKTVDPGGQWTTSGVASGT